MDPTSRWPETSRGTPAQVVVIPDFGEGLDTLDPSIEALERWGVRYLIDPVIEPIGFGFMASLERYAEVHRRYPGAPAADGRREHHRAYQRRHHRRERRPAGHLRRRSESARCSPPK